MAIPANRRFWMAALADKCPAELSHTTKGPKIVPANPHLTDNYWVELSGDIVVARLRGPVTEEALAVLHERVVMLLQSTASRKVLYDALEMDPPTVELTLVQQRMSEAVHQKSGRVAILVPSTRIAYLSRIAFGRSEHRVFYNDLADAIAWLNDTAE